MLELILMGFAIRTEVGWSKNGPKWHFICY